MNKQILDTMRDYFDECLIQVKRENHNHVIKIINDMKNFYMVENDLKKGQKKISSDSDLKVEEEIPEQVDDPNSYITPPVTGPIKHIYY